MKTTHTIKLFFANIGRYLILVVNAVRYSKEVKELRFIERRKKEILYQLLEEQRLVEENEKTKELQAKIDIINEILCFSKKK